MLRKELTPINSSEQEIIDLIRKNEVIIILAEIFGALVITSVTLWALEIFNHPHALDFNSLQIVTSAVFGIGVIFILLASFSYQKLKETEKTARTVMALEALKRHEIDPEKLRGAINFQQRLILELYLRSLENN